MRIIKTDTLTPKSIAEMTAQDREHIYNGLDAMVTLEVLNELLPQLDNVSRPTYEFSKALQAPVLEMTMRGVLVDQERRRQVLAKFRTQIAQVSHNLDRLIKDGLGATDLNWRSSQQLRVLFYDILKLPVIRKRSANGSFSPTVDRDAIEKLSNYFFAEPFCNHLLKLRELDKKRSFLETGIDSDGRIRCNFNIAGTNTGRLASSMSDFGTGTNMQNVDRDLRSVFIADPGMKFANLDLEQGDSRNVGAVCWNSFVGGYGEKFAGSYLDACESGDLHTAVARLVWPDKGWTGIVESDRKIADVIFYRQDSYRQTGKRLGHATNFYGQPPFVAKQTKVDRPIVETFQRGYFDAFPVIGVYDHKDKTTPCWHNRVRSELHDFHFITTLLGRRRYFFGRPWEDETLRAAIAYEPQSMTADEIDQGLLNIWRAHRVQPLLQVHDSLLIQFPEEQEDEIIPWALEQLKTTIILAKGREFSVPVEAKVGWNWGEFGVDNPDGLVKYKGGDPRKRTESIRAKQSIANLLRG